VNGAIKRTLSEKDGENSKKKQKRSIKNGKESESEGTGAIIKNTPRHAWLSQFLLFLWNLFLLGGAFPEMN